ncbi:hypothetical protein MAR_022998 [Mya arenaria]|uniref:Uncharacterized protein n=1 Tax=Mya arenaria TaxID=6604 RepID=A0ABY7DPN3_MYAAR|nr:hypothetical protein MAR_022998 [Mya arenaria]
MEIKRGKGVGEGVRAKRGAIKGRVVGKIEINVGTPEALRQKLELNRFEKKERDRIDPYYEANWDRDSDYKDTYYEEECEEIYEVDIYEDDNTDFEWSSCDEGHDGDSMEEAEEEVECKDDEDNDNENSNKEVEKGDECTDVENNDDHDENSNKD